MTRRGICYVDFTGDLRETGCGETVDLDQVTLFMSMATCPECMASIQARISKRMHVARVATP